MAVYRDGDVWRFRVSIRLASGKRVRLSGTPNLNTKSAAQAAEREGIRNAENPIEKAFDKVPFDAFATEWLATHPPASNRKSTAAHRESHLRMHLIPYFADTPLDQISTLALTRLAGTLLATKIRRGTTGSRKRKIVGKDGEDDLSASTVRKILLTLHKILDDAVTWERLDKMPKFPSIKVPKSSFDWLRLEESKRLLEAAASTDSTALSKVLFALRTGCRIGEQLAVKWSDIDFQSGKVIFRSSIWKGEEGPTKTGYERTVNLSPTLREILRSVRHDLGPYVFCDAEGKPLTYGHYQALLKAILKRSGLRHITWHCLRHTFASQLVSRGVHLKYVQEALGHSTIIMTMRYAHLAPSSGEEVALLD